MRKIINRIAAIINRDAVIINRDAARHVATKALPHHTRIA